MGVKRIVVAGHCANSRQNYEKLRLVGLPRPSSTEQYEATVSKVVGELSHYSEIASLYQIGGVTTPGISDIDIVAVFKAGTRCSNAMYGGSLDAQDRYRLMHSLFGISDRLFARREFLPPIFASRLLYGQEVRSEAILDEGEIAALREIYAVEYVLTNLCNICRQIWIGELEARGLLCSLKALAYDLDLLSDTSTKEAVRDFGTRVERLRSTWWINRAAVERDLLELPTATLALATNVLSRFSARLPAPVDGEPWREGLVCGPNQRIVSGRRQNGVRVQVLEGRTAQFFRRLGNRRRGVAAGLVRGIDRAFWTLEVVVPPALFAFLTGQGGELHTTVHRRRTEFLREYESFMTSIPSRYGMFDTLRWRPGRNRKWRAISGLNRLLWRVPSA